MRQLLFLTRRNRLVHAQHEHAVGFDPRPDKGERVLRADAKMPAEIRGVHDPASDALVLVLQLERVPSIRRRRPHADRLTMPVVQ